MNFQIFLTKDCNLNCSYCFEGIKQTDYMDKKIIPDLINFIKKYTAQEFVFDKLIMLNFNGGEALLNFPLLKSITEECKTENINSFSISTNFTLTNNDIIDFLIENNFVIQLSIDGRKATHDLNRKNYDGNGSFDTVYKNILLLKKRYPEYKNILYSLVYTPKTVLNLYDNIKYLVSADMTDIVVSYNSLDDWDEASLSIFTSEIKKIGDFYIKMFDNGKDIFHS